MSTEYILSIFRALETENNMILPAVLNFIEQEEHNAGCKLLVNSFHYGDEIFCAQQNPGKRAARTYPQPGPEKKSFDPKRYCSVSLELAPVIGRKACYLVASPLVDTRVLGTLSCSQDFTDNRDGEGSSKCIAVRDGLSSAEIGIFDGDCLAVLDNITPYRLFNLRRVVEATKGKTWRNDLAVASVEGSMVLLGMLSPHHKMQYAN